MFMKDHRERNIRPSQKTHPNGTEIAKEARFRFPRTIQLLSPAHDQRPYVAHQSMDSFLRREVAEVPHRIQPEGVGESTPAPSA
jgi:hypothetical protein